jgi:dihydrofolate synthase/folylpolyglutamate synthase
VSAPDPFSDLIAPFSRRGVDLGLERLKAALAELGHPERLFTAVQVAGTNGKGSISTMLHAIATAAGIRCGLYTSPHLLSWCERIRLPDGLIGAEHLQRLLRDLQPVALRHNLTPFELVTAAAMQAFAEAKAELVVLEVGLGGRLDATTVHPNREVLAFASIGLDHTEHLGPTIAAIAAEKAGVLHGAATAISGPQTAEATQVLTKQAQQTGCALRWVHPLPAMEAGGPELGLRGDLQRLNAAVAVGAAEALAERGWPINAAAIALGLRQARWPGRLDHRLFAGQPVLLDGAHNPPAAAALRHELDQLERQSGGPAPRRWLIGMQRHKDAPELLRSLLRPGDQVRVVALPAEHSSWSAAELQASTGMAMEQGEGDLRTQLNWLVQSTALPVACGSLYLVAELLPLLNATD